jgi:Domain of unknown function (DUF3303)
MKFMLTWRIHQEKRQAALKGFSQMTDADDKADMGDKIKLIGRWHDVGAGAGVAIFECDDAVAMANWALNWNPMLDIAVAPVLDDEETRKLGRSRN